MATTYGESLPRWATYGERPPPPPDRTALLREKPRATRILC